VVGVFSVSRGVGGGEERGLLLAREGEVVTRHFAKRRGRRVGLARRAALCSSNSSKSRILCCRASVVASCSHSLLLNSSISSNFFFNSSISSRDGIGVGNGLAFRFEGGRAEETSWEEVGDVGAGFASSFDAGVVGDAPPSI
jgi:hypothetical protein